MLLIVPLLICMLVGLWLGIAYISRKPTRVKPDPVVSGRRRGYVCAMTLINGVHVGTECEVEEISKLHSGRVKIRIVDLRIYNRQLMKEKDLFIGCMPTIFEEDDIEWLGDLSRKGIIDGIFKDLEE